MTALASEARVELLLRQTALHGSRRPIAVDRPLGPDGLGLDSLALVEFAVAFEREAGVELPEETWRRLAALTPADFAGILDSAPGPGAR